MTRYRVVISKRADKFLRNVDPQRQRRILVEIGDLENFPFFTLRHDLEKIKGSSDRYRLRQGDLRILFRVGKEQRIIFVEKVGRREDFYEQ